jgi:hypothetical protein
MCTLGDMKAGFARPFAATSDSLVKDSLGSYLSFATQVGLGEENTLIITPYAEGSLQVGARGTSVLLRVPFVIATGNLGTTADMGDVMVGLSQKVMETGSMRWTITAAAKLAQNRANKRKDFLSLPMPYQTSLGTNDLIFGTSLFYKRWHLAAGYQQPFDNNNENAFTREAWTGDADAQEYFESAHLRRGADAMLRVERSFALGSNEAFFGVQPVYHLQEDYITKGEVHEKVKGSDGLTLNLSAGYVQHVGSQSAFRFTVAAPAITRDVRPDGLTRFAVGMVAFERRF